MTRCPLALLVAVLPFMASAQTIYKCTDASGATAISNARIDDSCKSVVSSAPSVAPSKRDVAKGGGEISNKTPKGATKSEINPPRESSGSGVFVSKEHVLTSNHVVDRCTTVFVGKSRLRAEIKATDKVNDLALLSVPNEGLSAQAVKLRADDLRLGESIAVVGFPLRGLLSSDLNVTFGSVSSIKGLRDAANLFQFSAPVQPGNSGGPILDFRGNLLGIVMGGLNVAKLQTAAGITPQNVNFAVPIAVIKQFVSQAKVPFQNSPESKRLQGDELAELSRQFVVPITCNLKN